MAFEVNFFDLRALVTGIAYREVMKSPLSDASKSVRVNSESIQRELSQLIVHLEAVTGRVADARFRKIAMKSSEVLKGLRTLFERLGSEDQMKGTDRPDFVAPDAKAGQHSSEERGRTKSEKKSGRLPKPNDARAASTSKESASVAVPSVTKNSAQPGSVAIPPSTLPPAALAPSTPPVVSGMPEDPDETAAKARLRRKEARAPKRPGGHAPPRPLPPQSGKPIWSKPHSS